MTATTKLNPNTLYQAGTAQDVIPTQTQVAAIQATASGALQAASYAGVITVSGPFSGKPIIQKTTRNGAAFGFGSGPVPILLALTKPIAYLEYQVVDATSGAVIEAWQPYLAMLRPGTQTINPVVSCRLGWNFIQFRANGDNSSLVTSTVPFGVGDNIAVLGQSLAVTKFANYITGDPATIASLGVTINAYGSVFAAYARDGQPDVNNPPTWALPADGTAYNGTHIARMLNLLITRAGYNFGIVGYSVGNSAISEWQPFGSGSLQHLATFINLMKLGVTGWAVEIWEQGHADALIATPTSIYQQEYLTTRNATELYNSVTPRRIYQTIPGLGAYSTATTQTILAIRTALKQLSANSPNVEYVDNLNVPLWTDLIHPSQAGGIIAAQNDYRAVCKLLGLMPIGTQGPFISGALSRPTTNPTNILIPIQQRGGTALVSVGTPVNQFAVYLASDTALAKPLAINSITLATSLITLVLAADPGTGVALQVVYRPNPDTTSTISSGIFDNYVDSDGIATGRQLVDPGYILTVPGTGVALTVNAPTGAVAGQTVTVTGSYFGETPIVPSLTISTIASTTAGSTITVNGTYIGEIPS